MTSGGTVRERLRSRLSQAMRERDAVALGAVRSTLGAIGNAEAVSAQPSSGSSEQGSDRPPVTATHPRLAGTVVGVGAAEVARRELSDDDVRALVRYEIDERLAAASELEALGRGDRAGRLRVEADVLAGCLGP